ncbi:MAG: adenylate cyclase [Eubacteriales bacterium]|nr:adenylate cyclase [Eubacteriales bacterium]
MSFYPTIRIRRIDGNQYILTIKTHPEKLDYSGLQREEYEIPLAEEEYEALKERVIGNSIVKTRYIHKTDEGCKEEIDIFHNDMDGLALMEIEFEDVDSALRYPDPEWIIRDVTYDNRYKNSSLAKNGLPSD